MPRISIEVRPGDQARLAQLDALSIIERVCSVFSLLGCVFVIATFIFNKAFHKPINRLVFYASFGNMITNVATLMARSYVSDALGVGCQLQAFLIQMLVEIPSVVERRERERRGRYQAGSLSRLADFVSP